jgi:non-specific protein-tyrosine kinase
VTLRAYLRIFRERWRIVALFLVLGIGAAVLITAVIPQTYQASVQVFVSANTEGTSGAVGQFDQQAAIQAQTSTFAELIDTPNVLHEIERDLNLPLTDAQLRGKLTATAPVSQALVIVQATDASPTTAAAIANSAARAFIKVIEDYKKPTDSNKSAVQLFVTQPATAPSAPASPKPVLNVVLGIVLGLLVGVAVAIARDVLDNRVKDVESLARVAGGPAMGVIIDDPKAARHPIATRAGTRNMRAENFRQLRANLQFANVDQHPRVIAITSSVPVEGKTMVAMNLASTLAEAGFTVCLVDADLRRPTIAKAMGLPGPIGLTSVLIHQIDLVDALQSAGTNLFVLSSGPTPPNPSEVLASSYVRDVVRSLLDRVDYVVIDTAPLLPVADGSEVAALADGTLLVARHKLTTDPQIKRAAAALARVDARLLGVVLNRMPSKRRGEYSYTNYRAEEPATRPGASRDAAGPNGHARRKKVKEDVIR